MRSAKKSNERRTGEFGCELTQYGDNWQDLVIMAMNLQVP